MKKIIGLSALTLFAILAISPFYACAQPPEGNQGNGARGIEGTWNAVVTIRNCQTGLPIPNATFKAMDMFIQGGSVVDTNAAPTSTRGPAFGSWEHVSENRFTAIIRFFQYDAAGVFSGVRRVAQQIDLSYTGETWSSTVATTNFDTAGNQTSIGCATAEASRAH